MKMFRRIATVAIVAVSVNFLASCASDQVARTRSETKPARYAMTLPQIKEAAEKGDADAQYALGFMYYYGKKVERDMTLAKQWIRKAANQGQTRAITAMKLLGDTPPSTSQPSAQIAQISPTTQSSAKIAQKLPESRALSEAKVTALKEVPKFTEQTKLPVSQSKSVAANLNASTPIPAAVTIPAPKATKTQNTQEQEVKTNPLITTTVVPTKTAAILTPTTPTSDNTVLASSTGTTPIITDKQVQAFEKWLLAKQDDHFTLQLLGARNLDQVEKVIAQNNLANKSAIYHTMYKSEPWYVLVYGDYETPDDALAAIDRLPPMAQQLKPWVKPFASVKVGIRMSESKETA